MKKTNAAFVIKAFATVARPIILEYFPSRSCISSCRIAIECLRHFGITSRAVPVQFMVQVEALKKVYLAGGRPSNVKFTNVVSNIQLPSGPDGGWNGHLIVETRHCLIDPSFDQALNAVSDNETVLDNPTVLVLPRRGRAFSKKPFGTALASMRQNHTGAADLLVQYRGMDDYSYESAPAWELDYLLEVPIGQILREMKRQPGVGGAR